MVPIRGADVLPTDSRLPSQSRITSDTSLILPKCTTQRSAHPPAASPRVALPEQGGGWKSTLGSARAGASQVKLPLVDRTTKAPTVARYQNDGRKQLSQRLEPFVRAYNFARRPKTLGGLTPYKLICQYWTRPLERFSKHPIQQMPGLSPWLPRSLSLTTENCRCKTIADPGQHHKTALGRSSPRMDRRTHTAGPQASARRLTLNVMAMVLGKVAAVVIGLATIALLMRYLGP